MELTHCVALQPLPNCILIGSWYGPIRKRKGRRKHFQSAKLPWHHNIKPFFIGPNCPNYSVFQNYKVTISESFDTQWPRVVTIELPGQLKTRMQVREMSAGVWSGLVSLKLLLFENIACVRSLEHFVFVFVFKWTVGVESWEGELYKPVYIDPFFVCLCICHHHMIEDIVLVAATFHMTWSWDESGFKGDLDFSCGSTGRLTTVFQEVLADPKTASCSTVGIFNVCSSRLVVVY